MENINIESTTNLIKNNDNFLIITHKKPDGDTSGSASALCQSLKKVGKNAFIFKNEDITPKYEYLVKDFYADDNFIPDFVITTDIASEDLLTDSSKKYAGKIDLCIDHHFLSNSNFAKNNLVLDFASCGEVVYAILMSLNLELDSFLAEAIYVSISTDTGCFKYANTTANTHMLAAKCMPFIKAGELNRMLFDVKSKARLEIEKRVLNNVEYYFDSRLVFITISKQDKYETNATADDLDSIASLPRSIEGVEVAVTLTEQNNGDIKASIRTSADINASAICEMFSGGGHFRAAGANFANHTFSEVTKKIINATKVIGNYV